MPEPLTEHPAGRVRTWLAHHGFSIVASLGRLVQRPLASLLTITVMALALTLPAALGLALENLARLQGSVQASHDVTVFLVPGTPGRGRSRPWLPACVRARTCNRCNG